MSCEKGKKKKNKKKMGVLPLFFHWLQREPGGWAFRGLFAGKKSSSLRDFAKVNPEYFGNGICSPSLVLLNHWAISNRPVIDIKSGIAVLGPRKLPPNLPLFMISACFLLMDWKGTKSHLGWSTLTLLLWQCSLGHGWRRRLKNYQIWGERSSEKRK